MSQAVAHPPVTLLWVHLTPRTHAVNRRRVVRNPNYGWRALRLLSRRSPHFFQPTNQKFKSLADYLDSMVSKLAKELPVRCLKPSDGFEKKICVDGDVIV